MAYLLVGQEALADAQKAERSASDKGEGAPLVSALLRWRQYGGQHVVHQRPHQQQPVTVAQRQRNHHLQAHLHTGQPSFPSKTFSISRPYIPLLLQLTSDVAIRVIQVHTPAIKGSQGTPGP